MNRPTKSLRRNSRKVASYLHAGIAFTEAGLRQAAESAKKETIRTIDAPPVEEPGRDRQIRARGPGRGRTEAPESRFIALSPPLRVDP